MSLLPDTAVLCRARLPGRPLAGDHPPRDFL